MIYCVWYPSGGFGHFVNAILSVYGENFERPKGVLKFSSSGDSHDLDLVVPKYYKHHWLGNYKFDANKNYSVLVDNGINDETDSFKSVFPTATVIKICYDQWHWPIVAGTLIYKAMKSTTEKQLPTTEWSVDEPWARREKYFLFLKDHVLKNAWRPSNDNSILIEHMLDYNKFYKELSKFAILKPFESVWLQWKLANSKYIVPVETAAIAMEHIELNRRYNLRQVTDIWEQAIIYYFFYCKFGIEVPHNDFANWIDSTDELRALL